MIQQQLPLLPIQRRLWFLQQLESYGRDDIISLIYQVPDRLDHEQLQQRLNHLIESHDTLRVVIDSNGDNVTQSIAPDNEQHDVVVTLLNCDPADTMPDDLYESMARARQAVSGQDHGPLFRVDLLRVPDARDFLLLTAHRLICDVDSLEYVAARLLDVPQSSQLPDTDFATYVRSNGIGEHTGLDRWVEALRGSTHVCELPLDKTRPTVQQGKTANHLAQISTSAAAQVNRLAGQYEVSQSVVFMAAYFTLLYRYTLQDDILIGRAHRYGGQHLPAVGPFTDIAVVRQQFPEGMTFSQLLASLQHTLSGIAADQPPPFPLLLEALKPVRDLSRAPVIQHGFAFQDLTSLPPGDHPGVGRIYASAALHQLDIMLRIRADAGSTTADWTCDAALFSADTIQRMHRHFEALIGDAADHADRPMTQLSLMTPDENELITITWNETAAPVPDHDFVYRLFEKQAARTPKAIAGREPDREITYDALNRNANRMAHYLADQGIGADDIVAILADRDIDYQTAMLAINKAGGAFLPLSPMYPARRLASIFEKSETPLILIGANYLEAVQEAMQYVAPEKRPEIRLIKSELGHDDYPEANLPARCEMHNLAYIMFTSGSTGEPKGVMVHHAGMVNHNYAKLGDLEMGTSDILAQTSRQSFDIMVWQFLAPLIVGGSVYIMPDETALDPAEMLKETDRRGLTVLQLVPVNIEALLDAAAAMSSNCPPLKTLRWMVPTGDALHTDLCRRWLNLYPHTRMLNTYGATECSDDQCHTVIDTPPSPDYRPAIMTIGRPIINTQVYILDEVMQPVPVGVVGELYIAGAGVGPGYLKEPERTARTFVSNPFSNDPGSRLYRSGDQARYLPDGTIEFLGRVGYMIKLRGIRIEPGEIQAVLGRHPQVAQATLTVHDLPGLGAHLVAYVVLHRGEVITDDDLRTYLRQYLPDYMVPSYFVRLDDLPLNANGKIDRKALPVPDLTHIKSSIVAPRTDVESTLLDIWRKVLNRDELSVHDNFFDVGGYSLLAMRLFSQIERQFGRRLPLATIFRATTIADQAELLAAVPGVGGASSREDTAAPLTDLSCIVPIQTGSPERPPFFCVHAGGGHVIFFHGLARHLGKDQSFYGIQAVGIDGNLKPMDRFEDMAAVYVREMRVVQPEGPYYIGGECMGGTIAFEVARQLEEQGQSVGLLVMFDTFCAGIPTLKPGVPMWAYEVMFNVRRSRRYYFARMRGEPLGKALPQLVDIVQRTILTIRRIFFSRRLANTAFSDPLSMTQAALDRAEHAYRVGTIRTPITLFNSELPWGVTDDETLGWQGRSSGGIDIQRFPTLFDMMIEGPDVRLAAARLRELLDAKLSGPAD